MWTMKSLVMLAIVTVTVTSMVTALVILVALLEALALSWTLRWHHHLDCQQLMLMQQWQQRQRVVLRGELL
jgi:hypothetical protein